MSYYNTTNLEGKALVDAKEQTENQKTKILHFFEKHVNEKFTPHQIHSRIFGLDTPITSIRRAISDLTKEGKLSKTEILLSGKYGKPNHAWELSKKS